MATSVAPRSKNQTVIEKPTTPVTTIAEIRLRAFIMAITPHAISSASSQSKGSLAAIRTGGNSVVLHTASSATTLRHTAGIDRCRAGAGLFVHEPTTPPSRMVPSRARSTPSRAENGKARGARTACTRRRARTSAAPEASTAREMNSSGTGPCHTARFFSTVDPAAALAPAETSPSSRNGTRPRTSPARAPEAGAAQKDTGASRTTVPLRPPSAPSTRRAA